MRAPFTVRCSHPRSTKSIHRFSRNRVGVSREQQRHSCDVAVVFTGLVGTSHQYISNCRSIQLLISLEQFFKCQSG